MSNSANVHSLESIDTVKNSLVTFAEQLGQSLTILDAESKDAEAKRWVQIALNNTNRLVNLLEKSDLLGRIKPVN